jgi:hypothetical protein
MDMGGVAAHPGKVLENGSAGGDESVENIEPESANLVIRHSFRSIASIGQHCAVKICWPGTGGNRIALRHQKPCLIRSRARATFQSLNRLVPLLLGDYTRQSRREYLVLPVNYNKVSIRPFLL